MEHESEARYLQANDVKWAAIYIKKRLPSVARLPSSMHLDSRSIDSFPAMHSAGYKKLFSFLFQ